jgi:hypothetical protein
MIFVHYHPETGNVMQVNRSSRPFERAELKVAMLHPSQVMEHRKRYKAVNPQMGEFGWDYCSLVELPPEPPNPYLVRNFRNAELVATDKYLLEDFPITGEQRAAWTVYRQALRDLGQLPTGDAMIDAWPDRPDGINMRDYVRQQLNDINV